MLERVDRMLLAVTDRARASQNFQNLLGAQPLREETSAYLNARIAVLSVGESELELCEPAGDGPVDAYLKRWGEGLLAAGYATTKFDALAARLADKGVTGVREGARLFLPGTSTFGLPMVISPILVQTSLTLANTIFTVTALSFLGIGPPPPDPNWGGMLSEARQFMELAPLTVIGPAAAIVFATMTFIVLANGLRELLDVGSR